MGKMLNKVKGNMYDFVTHTWNTIKGECEHDCSYCYMKRFKQNPIRFDEKELKIDLGKGNFIFVGSSNDMFAGNIQRDWIEKTLDHCKKFNNKYLFQSKHPLNFYYWYYKFPENTVLCTTIESNRDYNISKAPKVVERFVGITKSRIYFETMITIEPVLDFDLNNFVAMLQEANPVWINIGADSGNNNLPEPSPEKIEALINALPNIRIKNNLKRLRVKK